MLVRPAQATMDNGGTITPLFGSILGIKGQGYGEKDVQVEERGPEYSWAPLIGADCTFEYLQIMSHLLIFR